MDTKSLKKRALCGIDITSRRAMWAEIERLRNAYEASKVLAEASEKMRVEGEKREKLLRMQTDSMRAELNAAYKRLAKFDSRNRKRNNSGRFVSDKKSDK